MKYRVTNAEGLCPTIVEADSPKEAAEEWAEFWLDAPDSSDVLVTLCEEPKKFNVVCVHEYTTVRTAKEITT